MKRTRDHVFAMLFGVSRALTHTYRYSTVPCTRPENVAEHSHWVTFYSWVIATLFQQRHPDEQVDMAELLQQAMLHDVDEAVTGDFLRGVKYKLRGLKDLLEQVAADGMQEVSAQLGLDIQAAWSRAKGPGFEGAVVRTADLCGVVAYMAEEVALGNAILRLRCDGTRTYLQEWRDKLADYPGLSTAQIEFLTEVVDACIGAIEQVGAGHGASLFHGLARVTGPSDVPTQS